MRFKNFNKENAPHTKKLEKLLDSGDSSASRGLKFNKHAKILIIDKSEAHLNSLCGKIGHWFLQKTTNVLSAFNTFIVKSVPRDLQSQIFCVYDQSEMKTIG